MTTLFIALCGLFLVVLGAAAIDPQQASMKKLLAVGAIAATLGLAGLPAAEAQTRSMAAGVQPAASYSAPTGQDSTAPTRSPNRAGGQKCWYVLDVLLCD